MNKSNSRKIIEFLIVTFFITWVCWGTIVIANGYGYLKYGTGLFMLLFIIGGNAPPIATYILQKKWGEITGFKDYMKCYLNPKANLKNYYIVVGLLLLHFLVPIFLGAYDQKLPLYYGLLMIPTNIVGGGFEEIGWRGVLQPLLEKSTSFIKATIIVATIWAVWHLPLWYIANSFQSGISFAYFTISVFGMTFLLALIRKITKNVFLCILFHSAINSFWGVLMLKQNHVTILTTVIEIIIVIYTINLYYNKTLGVQNAKSN